MKIEAKPRRLSLSNVLEHDQTRGTSALYDFSTEEQECGFLFSVVGLI